MSLAEQPARLVLAGVTVTRVRRYWRGGAGGVLMLANWARAVPAIAPIQRDPAAASAR